MPTIKNNQIKNRFFANNNSAAASISRSNWNFIAFFIKKKRRIMWSVVQLIDHMPMPMHYLLKYVFKYVNIWLLHFVHRSNIQLSVCTSPQRARLDDVVNEYIEETKLYETWIMSSVTRTTNLFDPWSLQAFLIMDLMSKHISLFEQKFHWWLSGESKCLEHISTIIEPSFGSQIQTNKNLFQSFHASFVFLFASWNSVQFQL